MMLQTDDMFRTTALSVIGAVVVAIGIDLVRALVTGRRREPGGRWRWTMRLSYSLTLLAVVVLAATALYGVFVRAGVEHWLLLAHVTAGGAFLVLLVVLALGWAGACRFDPSRRGPRRQGQKLDGPLAERLPGFSLRTRIAFWAFLVTGLTTATTMLVSMLPVVDTDGLAQLIEVHRTSGLALVVIALVHAYLLLLGKLGME